MHSASPQPPAAAGSARQGGFTPIKTVVKCCRLGDRETQMSHAAQVMFQQGNMSCSMCADDNGGQFPCQPRKP